MKEKLFQLFNIMKLIEVKGDSVLILADCIKFVDQLAQECENDAGGIKEDVNN